MIADRQLEKLFPRPVLPEEKIRNHYGLNDQVGLRRAWDRAGVMHGVDSLSRDEAYRLLLNMPKVSPDGKAARALYQLFLDTSDDLVSRSGAIQDEFMRSGCMWGMHQGVAGYFEVSELKHVDNESLPQSVRDQFKIVDLPNRVGVGRVEKAFGVSSLSSANVNLKVAQHQKAPGHTSEAERFDSARPYFAKLRESQNAKNDNVSKLDELSLVVCDDLIVQYGYEGKIVELSPPVWSAVVDQGALYVLVDKGEGDSISLDLLADAVGDGIANMFNLANGDAYSKIYRCDFRTRDKLLIKMGGGAIIADEVVGEDAGEEFRDMPLSEYGRGEREPTKGEGLNNEGERGDEALDSKTKDVEQSKKEDEPLEGLGPDGIDVTEVGNSSSGHVKKRKLVVKSKKASSPRSSNTSKVNNWEVYEELVEDFEADQGRYPIRVGNIMGEDGAGCDLFSFSSAEDREAFRNTKPRPMSLIDRFIEVKGGKSPRTTIDLKGNEYACARSEGSKYYLYGIHQQEGNTFHLSCFRDPVHQDDAVDQAVVIDLNAVEEECWQSYELSMKPTQGEVVENS